MNRHNSGMAYPSRLATYESTDSLGSSWSNKDIRKSLQRHSSDSRRSAAPASIDYVATTELRSLNYFEFEFFRSSTSDNWAAVERLSIDWQSILDKYADAFVVRVKCLLNANEPEAVIPKLRLMLEKGDMANSALDVVGKFSEFAVCQDSPARYCSTLLVVFPTRTDFDRSAFNANLATIIDPVNEPYVTLEMLDSFLARREYGRGDMEANAAMRLLEHNLGQLRPSSSLFLKLSSSHAEECLTLLRKLCSTHRDQVCDVLGERSLHKLAVSYTSRSTDKNLAVFDVAKQILETGADVDEWGYVAFNTLMRMAQDEDAAQSTGGFRGLHPTDKQSRVHSLNEMILQSSLDPLDKMALRVMSDEGPIGFGDARFERIWRIITRPDDRLSNDDFAFLRDLLDSGSPATCHLTSIVLRHCVELDNYRIGWQIASSVRSISKQVFGEVVHLCSKAYFKEIKSNHSEAGLWFERVRWCVERQLQFLNRYPCGLALHIASHARQFETCWRWFTAMRVELAFRLTGYHTSAVLKAASYADSLDSHIDKIKEVYTMTPSNEKSTFTFVPMTRIWEFTSADCRSAEASFWAEVAKDIRKCVITYRRDNGRDRKVAKVIQRLGQWEESFQRWYNLGSNSGNGGAFVASNNSGSFEASSPDMSRPRGRKTKTLGMYSSAGAVLRQSSSSSHQKSQQPQQIRRSSQMPRHLGLRRQESAPLRRSFNNNHVSTSSNQGGYSYNNDSGSMLMRPREWSNNSTSYPNQRGSFTRHTSGNASSPAVMARHPLQRHTSGGGAPSPSAAITDSSDPYLVQPQNDSRRAMLPNDGSNLSAQFLRVRDGSFDRKDSSGSAVLTPTQTSKWPVKTLRERQSSSSLSMNSWAPSIWSSHAAASDNGVAVAASSVPAAKEPTTVPSVATKSIW